MTTSRSGGLRRTLAAGAAGAAIAAVGALAVPATASADDTDTASLENLVGLGSQSLDMAGDLGFGVSDGLTAAGVPTNFANAAEVGVDVIRGQRSPQDLVNALDFTGSMAPTHQCNTETVSGGQVGVQTDKYTLAATGPGTIELVYDTINIPDKVSVSVPGGPELWSTYQVPGNDHGYVSTHGDWVQPIGIPAGVSEVLVTVTADLSGTQWGYTVGCLQ